jgi:hypothetical protein
VHIVNHWSICLWGRLDAREINLNGSPSEYMPRHSARQLAKSGSRW